MVRIACFKGDFNKAKDIVAESQDRAAAYHLARQLENQVSLCKLINILLWCNIHYMIKYLANITFMSFLEQKRANFVMRLTSTPVRAASTIAFDSQRNILWTPNWCSSQWRAQRRLCLIVLRFLSPKEKWTRFVPYILCDAFLCLYYISSIIEI